MINLWLEARPVPAPRPRVTKYGTYNDPKYTLYKKVLGLKAKSMIKKPLEGEIFVKIDFFYNIPKSWSKAKREAAKWHTSKPDIDNLVKTVLDSLNKIVFLDDGQVVSITARKQYANFEGTKIEIDNLKETK